MTISTMTVSGKAIAVVTECDTIRTTADVYVNHGHECSYINGVHNILLVLKGYLQINFICN